MHKWPRGDEHWQVLTHLNPKSNHLHLDAHDLMRLREGHSIDRAFYLHESGKFSQPVELRPNRFIISEGLHPFYLTNSRALLDLKIYLDTDQRLRRYWKIERDRTNRGYARRAVLQQLKTRSRDAKKFVVPQKQFADITVIFEPIKSVKSGIMALTLRVTNALNTDPFVDELKKIRTLEVSHSYEKDIENQSVRVSGSITADQIKRIGYQLVPDLEDLLDHRPKWHNNYKGINQLFVLYFYAKTKVRP